MTKAKAIKHLGYARESLEFWREKYVDCMRDTRSTMDIHMSMLGGLTVREQMIAEAIENINDAKARIARMERIAK